jgi:flagellar basal-body rod protein FlgB
MDNPPVNLFSGPISTLSRSLDLRARKHEMILKNVANADTPNFKPFKMNVEEALQSGMQTTQTSTLQRTDDQHLTGRQMADDPSTDMEWGSDDPDPLLLRGDQNGVDIDAEMTALAKNSLLYKVSTQIVSTKFKDLKKAITGGTQ